MLQTLHRLSSFFFYVLGGSFFLAYILLRNDVWPYWSALWLQIADLPFAFAAIAYGGLSLYSSLATPGRRSTVLALSIGIPLGVLFIVLAVLNFWGVGPLAA
jgi:hypothetical protein